MRNIKKKIEKWDYTHAYEISSVIFTGIASLLALSVFMIIILFGISDIPDIFRNTGLVAGIFCSFTVVLSFATTIGCIKLFIYLLTTKDEDEGCDYYE